MAFGPEWPRSRTSKTIPREGTTEAKCRDNACNDGMAAATKKLIWCSPIKGPGINIRRTVHRIACSKQHKLHPVLSCCRWHFQLPAHPNGLGCFPIQPSIFIRVKIFYRIQHGPPRFSVFLAPGSTHLDTECIETCVCGLMVAEERLSFTHQRPAA